MNLYEGIKNNLKESEHSSDYLNSDMVNYFCNEYYKHEDVPHKWTKKEMKDWIIDDQKRCKSNNTNSLFTLEHLDNLLDLQHDLCKSDLEESESSDLNDSIKSWYLAEFPDDDYGEYLKDDVTFKQVYDALGTVEDIYEVIFNDDYGDSIVRERIFGELSDRMNVDYDVVYYKWLYGREDGKSPNEGNHYSVKDFKEIVSSTMGESEGELDYRSGYKEIYGNTPDYTDMRRIINALEAICEQADEDGFNFCHHFEDAITKLSKVNEDLEAFYDNASLHESEEDNDGFKESDESDLTCFACGRPTTERDDNNKPICSECYSYISDLVGHGEWIEEEYHEKATYDDFKDFSPYWGKYFKTLAFEDIPWDALTDEAYEIYMRMPHSF